MRPLRLQSEVCRPEGGIDARSQRRTLGRPALDFFDLFLRETLQNSWDAATGDGPVHFSIDAWHTTPAQRAVLADVVFRRSPPEVSVHPAPGRDDAVLVVTDGGTRGLDGPTRADVAAAGRTNFVDMVRNTGRDPAKGYGGGTYGFGKAVLFEASACSTVVIYSRAIVGGTLTSRCIAMALGDPYESRGFRYTGRHWWGAPGGGMVEPVEGAEAEDLAASLGLTRLPRGTTGTSFMVLAPSTGGSPLRDVVARLADVATAYAWPHMVSTTARGPDIRFTFTCGGETFTPPDPATHPQLRHHVEAYRRCEDLLAGTAGPARVWPWTVEEIRSQRPDRRLGAVAFRDYPYTADGRHDTIPADVALLRSPRFVVRYMPVKPAPSGQATAGVFIAAAELDADFAASEPASHDDWRPANLGLAPNQRNPVRRALTEIKARFNRHTVPVTASQATHHPGTVSLASRLGVLLDGSVSGSDPRIPAPAGETCGDRRTAPGPGDGPEPGGAHGTPAHPAGGEPPGGTDPGRAQADGRHTGGAHGSAGRRGAGRPRAWLGPSARIVSADGAPAVEFSAEVVVPDGARGASVTAEPYVLVDGGRESDPPVGAATPRVLWWREAATGEIRHGSVLSLASAGVSHWQITVSQPPDTAVSVRLEARETAA